MAQSFKLSGQFTHESSGNRLDQALADLFPDYSRSRIKNWIEQGRVAIDGQVVSKPRHKVLGFESVELAAELEDEVRFEPEDIPLNIVYEDDDILVINKPVGLVVHPGAGVRSGTLLNALLHHDPQLVEVPRAGIVHRLDKDTSGLMVVAKNIPAQTHLVAELQARNITREYEAVANGRMTAGGSVNEPIGRHPTRRIMMAVTPQGKDAVTHYRVMEKYRAHTRIRCRLETGRTHQIRVHMAYIRHALVGDPVYGGRPKPTASAEPKLVEALRHFRRQALHAARLILEHPATGEIMEWTAPIPEDMQNLVAALQHDSAMHDDYLD